MASEQVKATEWVCDGCERRVVLADVEGAPYGFHGTAYENGSWGGGASVTWWACSRKCIRPAVTNAIGREESGG